jgi:hypothetical protein
MAGTADGARRALRLDQLFSPESVFASFDKH